MGNRFLVRANILAAVLLAVLVVFIFQHSQTRTSKEQLEELDHRIESLKAQGRSYHEALVRSESSAVKERTSIVSNADDNPDGATNQGSGLVNLLDPVLFADPAYTRLYAAADVYEFRLTYSSLFERLKLANAQRDALIELLVQRHVDKLNLELSAATFELNVKSGGVTLRDKVIFAIEQEYRAKISELIGPANFDQLIGFERTLPVRRRVDALDDRLTTEGQGLTAAQIETLVAQLSPNVAPNGAPVPVSLSSVLANAESFLSHNQIAVLQQRLHEEERLRQFYQDLQPARRNSTLKK